MLAVPGMCCGAESAVIEKALQAVVGVAAVRTDILRREVTVEHDSVCPDALLEAAKRTGMEARTVPAAPPLAPIATATSTLLIEKMDCPTEEALIRKRLGEGKAGVSDLSFNLLERTLVLRHPVGGLPQVLSALEEIGLPGSPKPDRTVDQPGGQKSWLSSNWKLAAGGISAIAAEGFALTVGDTSLVVVVLAAFP